MKPNNTQEELRKKIRAIIIDPSRLEFGHEKVNLRVGGTVDRIMSETEKAINSEVRQVLDRLEEDVEVDWYLRNENDENANAQEGGEVGVARLVKDFAKAIREEYS